MHSQKSKFIVIFQKIGTYYCVTFVPIPDTVAKKQKAKC